MVVAVVYITHTQPKQQIPMIQPQEQISMVEPHTTTFAEPIMKEVCPRIDGCRVIDGDGGILEIKLLGVGDSIKLT